MAIPLEAMGGDDDSPPREPYRSPAECRAMSDAELADHLERGDFDHDGLSFSARIAIVRLLRKT